MKIYIASSWKNNHYNRIKTLLETRKHIVMDWRMNNFKWGDITPIPEKQWSVSYYRRNVMQSDHAKQGFDNDYSLMMQSDLCVLLLPSGRSAHIEAGWFAGHHKPLIVHIPEFDTPELMYGMASKITCSNDELLEAINEAKRTLY